MTDREVPSEFALLFDGSGGARQISADQATETATAPSFIWRHFNYTDPDAHAVLADVIGLEPDVASALTAPETRPRCEVHGAGASAGVYINLRGVNLHEGAAPEDMISIRIWLERGRIISVWRRPLFAMQDVLESIERGQGPASPADFVARLALRIADRAEPVIATLQETVDSMEEAATTDAPPGKLRRELGEVRRIAIMLRRYMFPQRDALSTLAIEDVDWLSQRERSRLREATDRITRLAEELDAIRDRAAIVHEHLIEQRGEVMNRNMLILAVVTAIFLPLGLLTGLLGANVGGIPGATTSWAFWAVCGLLALCALFQLWLFRRLKLI